MAVPRDLVVTPPIPERLQCTPQLNTDINSPQGINPRSQLGTYRGFCLRGEPDGRGEWVGQPGYSYVGDWRDDLAHGHGKYTDPGSISWGEWRYGERHGKHIICQSDGTLLFAGTCTMGEYRSGIVTDKTGAIRVLGHALHGHGVHCTANGDKYVGKWWHGNPQGWGVEQKASGDEYVGEWVDGCYHGWGKYTCAATGATRVGQWRMGDPLESCPSSCWTS